MNKSISVADVKATLSQCIREVEGGDSIIITRHGKVVAALVPPDDIAQLERLKNAGPQSGLASLAGGWENSDELVNLLKTSKRIGSRTIASPEK